MDKSLGTYTGCATLAPNFQGSVRSPRISPRYTLGQLPYMYSKVRLRYGGTCKRLKPRNPPSIWGGGGLSKSRTLPRKLFEMPDKRRNPEDRTRDRGKVTHLHMYGAALEVYSPVDTCAHSQAWMKCSQPPHFPNICVPCQLVVFLFLFLSRFPART